MDIYRRRLTPLLAEWADVPIHEWTPTRLRQFIRDRQRQRPRPWGPATVKMLLRFLPPAHQVGRGTLSGPSRTSRRAYARPASTAGSRST